MNIRIQALALSLALLSVVRAPSTQAEPSAPLHILSSYQGSAAADYHRTVALGNNGSLIFSDPNGGGVSLSTASAIAGSASAEIWANNSSPVNAESVSAASQADAYARLSFSVAIGTGSPSVPKLALWRSTSSQPVWTKTFDPVVPHPASPLPHGLFVSQDGSRVLAWWYDYPSTTTHIAGFTGAGQQLFHVSSVTYLPPQSSATDLNAARIFLNFSSVILVLDGSNGAPIKSLYGPTGGGVMAVGPNADSLTVCTDTGALVVYRTGAAYLAYAYTIPAIASMMGARAGLSADGRTLVVGYQHNVNLHSFLIRFFDLGATGFTEMGQYTMQASGSQIANFSDVVVSNDGKTVAASTTGDQNATIPSILVFSRSGNSYALTASTTLPAGDGTVVAESVTDLALSPDGRMLAAAGARTTPIFQHPSLAFVKAFDLGGDLSVVGMPEAGSTIIVELKTTPGLPCALFMSETLAATAVSYGNTGNLFLQNPGRVAIATADSQGKARFELNLSGPAFVPGHTYNVQALTLIGRRLSANYAPFTVVQN